MPVLNANTSSLPGAAPLPQRGLRADPALALLPGGGEAAENPVLLYRPTDLVNPVGDYATLVNAIADALAGDVIVMEAGVAASNNVTVGVDNLTIIANAGTYLGLWMTDPAQQVTLSGYFDWASRVIGTSGNDTITVDTHFHIFSGAGDDVIHAENGRVTFHPAQGNNTVYGGASGDIFHAGNGIGSGTGNDYFDAGAGRDLIDFTETGSVDLVVNLNHGLPQVVSALHGTDTLLNFEDIDAGSGNDLLVGNASNNLITGAAGDDEIYGLGGADRLSGGYGDDMIEGSCGNDTMYGGPGADTLNYYHAAGGVTVNLGMQGTPQDVGGQAGIDLLFEFEHLYGSRYHDDVLIGEGNWQLIVGFGGNDLLMGGHGNDTLYGMQGNDTLDGGLLADRLGGGGGYDVFVYNWFGDSWISTRDTILDFEVGADLIDVSGMDANEVVAGHDTFTFIGSAVYTGAGGELRFATDGTDGWVMADVRGNGKNDMVINLLGVTAMDAGDFIL